METSKWLRYFAGAFALMTSGGAFAAGGGFDPTFNGVGFTRNSVGTSHGSGGIAIHSTGEIVTVEQSFGPDRFFLSRHLADGRPDMKFGGNGTVDIPPPTGSFNVSSTNLEVDHQDRIILIVGIIGPPADAGFNVYRFNFDGSPDSSFSKTGRVIIPIGTRTYALTHVVVQPDEKIVGVGGAVNPATELWEFFVFRLQEDGELDPSFGGTGRVWTQVTPGGGDDRATGIALQPDGKIVVAGRARTLDPGAEFDFALARYLPNGELDEDFGNGGRVIFPMLKDNLGRKVVIQPDGKIVIAGYVCEDIVGGEYCFFGVARVDDRGVLDPSFGDSGKVLTDVGDGFPYDVALQSDNKIVAVGPHRVTELTGNNVLVRYLLDGSLDRMFGVNGISETNYGYVSNAASHVRLQSDGRIVVCGGTGNAVFAKSVIARYLADGAVASIEATASKNHSISIAP